MRHDMTLSIIVDLSLSLSLSLSPQLYPWPTLSQFGVGFKLLFFLVIIVICIQSTGSGRVAELLER